MATLNLGSSIPVPSIKELVAQPLDTVPLRYIRDLDADYPTAAAFPGDSSVQLPLLDMAKLVDPQYQEIELQKLHDACKNWGIFQLIGHGVPDESLKAMHKKTQEFFDLSPEDKNQYAQKPGSLEGYGQAFVISEDQKLEWCDMIFLKAIPTHTRKLEFWPEEQPRNFREALHVYSHDMRKTAVSIIGFIAMALGLDFKDFREVFEGGNYDVRMNCYPPCPEPERVIGISSHADLSGITLLTDCGDIPGLQVLKDGRWVFVEPITDGMVVNIGIIMEIVSNGVYKAPYHRAAVNRHKDRFSIVTFCYPSKKFDIKPAKELINPDSLALYKSFTNDEYFRSFYERTELSDDGVPFIDTVKI
ncbi:protein SRG1-like isoform X2 [Cynara cardunculus var. scolymus]|uniref:Non-heme dioxygenase N-terminal domain-containing protein n=1 Tax=Cynara cardunculus var. scolymus TaxID=59895 RepID=A0A118JZZ5_CYNCS|nr:protein SRG1-like isoform X2 [Cynara cardunculus var. scolymus]KVI00632.1 Non-heme dioxygenase N-terminal domain-containing protein [Cynara cardunculus var. scolymus]